MWERSHGHSPWHPTSGPKPLSPRPTIPAPHRRLDADMWTGGCQCPQEGLPATSPRRKPLYFADNAVLQREALPSEGSTGGKKKGDDQRSRKQKLESCSQEVNLQPFTKRWPTNRTQHQDLQQQKVQTQTAPVYEMCTPDNQRWAGRTGTRRGVCSAFSTSIMCFTCNCFSILLWRNEAPEIPCYSTIVSDIVIKWWRLIWRILSTWIMTEDKMW